MRTYGKRLLSGFLSLVMLMTLLPMQTFATKVGTGAETSASTEASNPFVDVKEDDWFADSANYAYEHDIFKGTSATTFSPYDSMDRAMLVTVLGRMAQVDLTPYLGASSFVDVSQDAYYAAYVAWAMEKGLTTGMGGGRFAPNEPVTRAQISVFFYRYMTIFQVPQPEKSVNTLPADLDAVPDYAQEATIALWQMGLLKGDEHGNVNPMQEATRSEVATTSMRLDTHLVDSGMKTYPDEEQPEEPQPETPTDTTKPSGGGGGGGGSSSQSYTIKLHNPDDSIGTMTQSTSVLNLGGLTTPTQDGCYFLGWYYDASYTRQALDGDTLTATSTDLYAKMLKSGEIETSETPYFTVQTDVASNFTITVNSSNSNADLTKAITFTGPEQYVESATSATSTDDEMAILSVTRSADGSTYTIKGPNDKLVAGGSYQVVLEDDALTFGGVDEASIREYHFTVKESAPVMNLSLKDSVKEIPISQITSASQISTQSLSPVNVLAGESGSVSTSSDDSGTFIYAGNESLEVGDTVALYEGTAPKERGADSDDLSDVSYVTITEVSGTTYTYTAATAEEVLFMPDVLPIQSGWDQDTSDDNKLTISAYNLTTTMNDVEAESLDEGDFLAFYTGTSLNGENAAVTSYGRVTEFGTSGGNYIITYESATKDDVKASMDFATKNNVSGDELMDGVDIDKMEEDIAQQAIDSGFAQIAAQNIAAAVSTMSLDDLEDGELDLSDLDLSGLATKDLSFGVGPMSLQSASVATYDATSGGGGSGTEFEIESVNAQISTNLNHFEGTGVRIMLEMTVSIKFDAGEEDEKIIVKVTPTFVQELKLDISSSGGVKIKWKWGFIPYVYDFYASVSVDMYTYTSINLNATITSGSDEEDTVSQVKDLLDKVNEVVDDLSKKLKGENVEVAEGISELQDLYCEMLENDSEWITLYRRNINKQNWSVAMGVINITLTIDFVVQANVNISLGLEFDYTNAKRYQYSIYIFHGKSTNSTINLLPESYNLQLYAMGVLGLRAGVEVSLSVDLITKKVASVGIVVNVGAYLKVYGYVVYELHHVANTPDKSSGSGALYIEVGCYLDIGMDLSAFGGKLSWKPTLYDNEWPLWSAGSSLAVSGFAAAQTDEDDEDAEEPEIPVVYMRKGQTTVDIPSDLLTMAGFDMKTGADAKKKYDYTLFDISFSDDRFSLTTDGKGQITLDFGDGVTWNKYNGRELESDMTITWLGAPMSFNTETIQLKTTVHWDQYDEYSYAIFDVQGADTKIPTEKLPSAGTLTIPEMKDADHPGYYWRGWTVERVHPDGTLETLTLDGNTVEMKGYDLQLTANWEPKKDIHYWIQPMFQKLDGTYEKGERYEVMDGQVDIEFAPALTDFDGYVTPDIGNRHRIKADGTSEIIANYPRQQYSFVRYLYEDGSFMSGAYLYGDTIDWTHPTRDGYTFTNWTVTKDDESRTPLDTLPETMPTYGLIATANWTVNEDTPYTANCYTQNEDGSYTLKEAKKYTGKTETVVKPSVADSSVAANGGTFDLPTYDGYTLRDNCKNITITINGSGTASANYYYDLNHTTLMVKHVFSNGKAAVDEILNCVGASVPNSEKTFTGYTFEGWYANENCTTKAAYPTTLTRDTTLYAKWTPNDVTYTVEHYQQALDGGYPTTPAETEQKTGKVDEIVTPNRKSYEGFTAPEETNFTLTTTEETNVIRYEYIRNRYTLTLVLNGGTSNESTGSNVKYGALVAPADPERAGYTFGGWYTDIGCTEKNKLAEGTTMPASTLTLYAKWTPNNGIAYKVEHYQQNANDDQYTLVSTDTENKTGTAGEQTAAEAKTYEGFTAQSFNQTAIAGDGTTVVKIYYDRVSYTLTYDLNDAGATFNSSDAGSVTARYGATVSLPTANDITYDGHSLEGWYTDKACTDGNKVTNFTMPANATTLYAKWTVADTSYTVNVYLQNVTGEGHTKSDNDSYTASGSFGSTAPTPQEITGFTTPEASEKTLTMDESENVIDYYYTRNQYTLSYDGFTGVTWGEEGTAPTASEVYYGAAITTPDMGNAEKTGYTFAGWYTDSGCTDGKELADNATMPAANTTLYAKWTPITYTLRFKADGNVPLINWLNSQDGVKETWPEAHTGDYTSDYDVNNYYGMPYFDITVSYDQPFNLPMESTTVEVNGTTYTLKDCGVTGFTYGGEYNSDTYTWDPVITVDLGDSITNATDTDGAIVEVSVVWPYMDFDYDRISTEDNPAKIYSVSQLWAALVESGNSFYPYSKLMVDLDINCKTFPAGSSGIGSGVSDGCFNGNGHTIKAMSYTVNKGVNSTTPFGALAPALGSNFIVKNVTLDGFTISAAHSDETDEPFRHYYGGLFGYVGDDFQMEDVTVKNLTMDLTLNSASEKDVSCTLKKDYIGGLVGYAAGSVTLTNCTIEAPDMNVTMGGNDAAIGSLIGGAVGALTVNDGSVTDLDGYGQIGETIQSSTDQSTTEDDT